MGKPVILGKINKTNPTAKNIGLYLILSLWLALIAICFFMRDRISLKGIIDFSPAETGGAVLIVLLLFSLKSITFVIYSGILYTASGVLFDLPLAIIVNIAGSFLIAIFPYFIGKKLGKSKVESLNNKYPKLNSIEIFPQKSDFAVSFCIKITGCIPTDPFAMLLGARGMKFYPYIMGAMAGSLPTSVLFAVIGMGIKYKMSLPFYISSAIVVVITLVSSLIFIYKEAKYRKIKDKLSNAINKRKDFKNGNNRQRTEPAE